MIEAMDSNAPDADQAVPIQALVEAQAKPFRIPMRRRALSVGELMEKISETERLHRRRIETTQYQGPILFVTPENIPVPADPVEPRTREQKVQTYRPTEVERELPKLWKMASNAADGRQLCDIRSENEVLIQIYKRLYGQRIFGARQTLEQAEEIREDFAKVQRTITGKAQRRKRLALASEGTWGDDAYLPRYEIITILNDLEAEQMATIEQAQMELEQTRYQRAVLTTRWERHEREMSERTLRMREAMAERRREEAAKAVKEHAQRRRTERIRITAPANPPTPPPAKEKVGSQTHRPKPTSAEEDRILLARSQAELEQARRLLAAAAVAPPPPPRPSSASGIGKRPPVKGVNPLEIMAKRKRILAQVRQTLEIETAEYQVWNPNTGRGEPSTSNTATPIAPAEEERRLIEQNEANARLEQQNDLAQSRAASSASTEASTSTAATSVPDDEISQLMIAEDE